MFFCIFYFNTGLDCDAFCALSMTPLYELDDYPQASQGDIEKDEVACVTVINSFLFLSMQTYHNWVRNEDTHHEAEEQRLQPANTLGAAEPEPVHDSDGGTARDDQPGKDKEDVPEAPR